MGKLLISHRYNHLPLLSSDPGGFSRSWSYKTYPSAKVTLFSKSAKRKRKIRKKVEEIFTDLAPLAEKRSVTLETEGDAALTGSDALIYRLLFNLTENAVKYNRPGGSVRVELTQGQEKCIIRVSDTGCGIPEEYQRSIFHPFFRVDKSRSREYGGAGLGLSLVWEIADLHGGSVWVEESSDKGTTIAVELPAGTESDSPGADIP